MTIPEQSEPISGLEDTQHEWTPRRFLGSKPKAPDILSDPEVSDDATTEPHDARVIGTAVVRNAYKGWD